MGTQNGGYPQTDSFEEQEQWADVPTEVSPLLTFFPFQSSLRAFKHAVSSSWNTSNLPLVNFSLWEPSLIQCGDLSSFCSLKSLYFNMTTLPILLSDMEDYLPIHILHYWRYPNFHQVKDWHQSFSSLLSHHPYIY